MHPEAKEAQIGVVRQWAASSSLPGWNPQDVPTSRVTFRKGAAIKLIGPLTEVADVADIALACASGPRPARVYRPLGTGGRGTVIYVHGGGYAVGGLEEADAECRRLCSSIGCNLISITYRLAPEHPYPAGIEDAVDAIRAVRREEAGFKAGAIAVLGVSSGAGIATAAMRRLIAAHDAPSAALVLLSPWLDATLSLPSNQLYATGCFQEMSQMRDFQRLYVGDTGVDLAAPELSPARHPVPANWPYTIILAAEMDPLADDAALFARRLSEAGVRHAVRYSRGHLHGFHTWWQRMPSIAPDLAWLDEAVGDALSDMRRD